MDETSSPHNNKERAEEVRRFFTQPCDFVLSAGQPEHFNAIEGNLPEVAFWGRSNVGKSSLINAVTGRKGLARASNTPGRTQQIVFFNMADKIMFVDLPGYGHAQAPKAEINKWNSFIKHYMKTRSRLRCVILLVDGRHGIKANDDEMMSFLDKMAVNYQVVLTKADQMRGIDRAQRLDEIKAALRKHPAARPDPLLTSSEKGDGIQEVRDFIYSLSEIG